MAFCLLEDVPTLHLEFHIFNRNFLWASQYNDNEYVLNIKIIIQIVADAKQIQYGWMLTDYGGHFFLNIISPEVILAEEIMQSVGYMMYILKMMESINNKLTID